MIQEIIKRKAMNKSGKLFKLGIHIANCKVVLEASKRMRAMEEDAKKERDISNEYREGKAEKCAVIAFENWKKSANKYDKNGLPKMPADDYKHILKAILPKIAPDEGTSQHTKSGKKALERLLQIAGGTTWEVEMEAYAKGSMFSSTYVPAVTTGAPKLAAARLF